MNDPLEKAITVAFNATVEAENYAYPAGLTEIKRALIEAHSALLRAKNLCASRKT